MTNINIVVSITNKVCSWKSPDYFFYSASFFLNLHSSFSTEAFETIKRAHIRLNPTAEYFSLYRGQICIVQIFLKTSVKTFPWYLLYWLSLIRKSLIRGAESLSKRRDMTFLCRLLDFLTTNVCERTIEEKHP